MKKVWQAENVSGRWAVYMVGHNIEYISEIGDNLIFDSEEEAREFVHMLNMDGEIHKLATLRRLKIKTAFEMLEDAEVMQEFDDCVWVKVNIYQWETFNELTRGQYEL